MYSRVMARLVCGASMASIFAQLRIRCGAGSHERLQHAAPETHARNLNHSHDQIKSQSPQHLRAGVEQAEKARRVEHNPHDRLVKGGQASLPCPAPRPRGCALPSPPAARNRKRCATWLPRGIRPAGRDADILFCLGSCRVRVALALFSHGLARLAQAAPQAAAIRSCRNESAAASISRPGTMAPGGRGSSCSGLPWVGRSSRPASEAAAAPDFGTAGASVSSKPLSEEKRKRQPQAGQVAMTAREGRRSGGSSRLKPHSGQTIFTIKLLVSP